jgi:hypothetical protein
MNERDIVKHVASIVDAIDKIKGIEQSMGSGVAHADLEANAKKMEDAKEDALLAGLQLLTTVVVDINRIATALEFVASQHNNSEALFKA